MGIDVSIETAGGVRIAEILDPKGYVSWILAARDLETTACLRFIDPYGDTIFNRGQLHVLLAELEATRPSLTNDRLESSKQQYLSHAASWPEAAFNGARHHCSSLSLEELRGHFDRLVSLVRHALDQGPHHYVRFIGD